MTSPVPVPSFEAENALLQFEDGGDGQEQRGRRNAFRPRHDIAVRSPASRLPQLRNDIRVEQDRQS